MKPYGRDQEPRRTRDCADLADCATLGLPSRAHPISSQVRKTSRRRWARAERQATQKFLDFLDLSPLQAITAAP